MAQQTEGAVFGPARTQYERNPVEDACNVVTRLVNDGTVDRQHKVVLKAMQHDDMLRAAVEQKLQAAGLMDPTKDWTAKERDNVIRSFIRANTQELLILERDAMYRILTDESDPNGLVAEHKQLVKQALLATLEEEEIERQRRFRALHQQHFVEEQAKDL